MTVYSLDCGWCNILHVPLWRCRHASQHVLMTYVSWHQPARRLSAFPSAFPAHSVSMVYQLEAIERSDWECFLCVSDAAGRSAPGHELHRGVAPYSWEVWLPFLVGVMAFYRTLYRASSCVCRAVSDACTPGQATCGRRSRYPRTTMRAWFCCLDAGSRFTR